MNLKAQNQNELFDVVDLNDHVIAQATRLKVHTEGLLHRAIHVFLFNNQGEVLLQLRSKHKDLNPNVWDSSVSGHLDSGESYLDAAQREIGEELNTQTPEDFKKLTKVAACPETGNEFVELFAGHLQGSYEFNPVEIEDVRWWKVIDLVGEIKAHPQQFSPCFAYLWREAWERNLIQLGEGKICF